MVSIITVKGKSLDEVSDALLAELNELSLEQLKLVFERQEWDYMERIMNTLIARGIERAKKYILNKSDGEVWREVERIGRIYARDHSKADEGHDNSARVYFLISCIYKYLDDEIKKRTFMPGVEPYKMDSRTETFMLIVKKIQDSYPTN